jgi:Tfp pilus assembly protein PilF
MPAHYDRALLLFQQSRYDLAEKELRDGLTADPNHAQSHSLLALCLAEREAFDEAEREGRTAIGLAPDLAFGHYAMGTILHTRGRLADAEEAALEAIRLDAYDAENFSLLGAVRMARRDWAGALKASEEGLAIDAEHVACNNLRAMALVKLGRKGEAGKTIESALQRDPEDAMSHANMGWTLLERNEPQKALEHFREALRLNPNMEWARAGIVEAMKARYLIYGLMLRYFLWMSKLSGAAQWMFIIGLFLGMRLLRTAFSDQPWFLPVFIAYVAFALMTWIADPLFNLILRLNRFGRMALSREQVVASNLVGLCLLGALGSLGYWIATKNAPALIGALVCGALLIPVSSIFNCDRGWPRWVMILITLALAAAGFGSIYLQLTGERDARKLAVQLLQAYLIGIFITSWVANALMQVRVKR